tara:strand:- start:143 stop:1885 length:1743 start_codon:yes stop_codon:yes gene_type:complete
MIKNLNSKIENPQIIDENNDEIDLRLILNFLLRNKSLIGLIALITFVSGIIYSFTLKEVWEGKFQIVLKTENQSPNINPTLANITGIILSGENELTTEVEILKSPSVLMPVFEFATLQNNQSKSQDISFSNWKDKYLSIELENNTSILNISYRNKVKETIIPTLKKMSISYQEYSGRNKKRSQQNTFNFLKEQISIFKNKSANSLKAAQEYAIDQDLVLYDLGMEFQKDLLSKSNNNILSFLSKNNSIPTTNSFLSNFDIETSRVQAANQIRKINIKLEKIKELSNTKELQYIASTIPSLVQEGLPQSLSEIDSSLIVAKGKYTDKDIKIQELLKRRELIIDLLKDRTISFLEVQKLEAEATMKASIRPKGVLLKYKELLRESGRDEATLIQLEDKFNVFKLELARQEDPWELITNPTLLENPVSPNLQKISIFSLIIGSFLGILFSLFNEKRSGKIYEVSQIEKLIPIKLLSQINLNKIEYESKNLFLIKDLLNKKSKNLINFVPLGNTDIQDLDNLKKSLIKEKFVKDIIISSDKDENKESSNYLILKLGYINYSDIFILNKRIELLENNFNGLIILT